MAKLIDCTPKWEGLISALIHLVESGDTEESRQIAKDQLRQMARVADKYVDLSKKPLRPMVLTEPTLFGDIVEPFHDGPMPVKQESETATGMVAENVEQFFSWFPEISPLILTNFRLVKIAVEVEKLGPLVDQKYQRSEETETFILTNKVIK